MLGALLRLAHHASLHRLSRWLEESTQGELQPAHLAVIQPLWGRPEGARLTALAQASHITKQSMGALVDHLERVGYVERVEDPDDGRAQRVRLTARGRAFAKNARAYGRSDEIRWAAKIGEKRIAELRETLELFLSAQE